MSEQVVSFRVWWDEAASIVNVEWLPGAVVDLAAAQAATRAVRALSRGPVPMLVDTRGMKEFDRSARAHFLEDQSGAGAMALLASSAVSRMIANFFIGMQRQPMPVRMFTDRAAAVAWLHERR